MKNYKLVRVGIVEIGNEILLQSTHKEILEEINTKLEASILEKLKIKKEYPHTISIVVDYGKSIHLGWEIRKYLCDQGWEPYAVGEGGYYFRKEEDLR
jgi:hypothetical protein